MTTPTPDDPSAAAAPPEAPHEDALSEEQLGGVVGAAGPVIDCEGYTSLPSSVLGSRSTSPKIKQPE